MKQQRKAFTLVELVVVITILITLSTIGFLTYTSQLLYSRNAVRISDMGNIKMALKSHKTKNGWYPIPGHTFDVTNSGTIIKQGYLDGDVFTQEITKKPTDPLLQDQYYLYSITHNKLFFQVWMSIENKEDTFMAYVDGDYQTLHDGFIPSIVFASDTGWDIETLSWAFIVDKGTFNIPYDGEGNKVYTASSLEDILTESWVSIPKFYGYLSCLEIYENGASMGSWVYMILDSNSQPVEQTCDMNY